MTEEMAATKEIIEETMETETTAITIARSVMTIVRILRATAAKLPANHAGRMMGHTYGRTVRIISTPKTTRAMVTVKMEEVEGQIKMVT